MAPKTKEKRDQAVTEFLEKVRAGECPDVYVKPEAKEEEQTYPEKEGDSG